jgi:formylglycine-generating enzyme required for sulfatase activity
MSDQSLPQNWQDLHGFGLFLSCFRRPSTLQEVSEAADWQPLLHCEPEFAAHQLIAQGFLKTVETVDKKIWLLRCTQRGEIRSTVYLEQEARHLPDQEDLPHALWGKAVIWLITGWRGWLLGSSAIDILFTLAEESLEREPSELPRCLPIEPELLRIPAGFFVMGTSRRQMLWLKAHFRWAWLYPFKGEQPRHKLWLPAYEIGRYPVTNAQYAAFVEATGYKTPYLWVGHRIPPGRADHPVCDIGWYDAQAYVAWLQERTGRPFRLPTEAEWEKAARGTDGRIWPWGNRPPESSQCNLDRRPGVTTPVGRYSPGGDSPYGCADMVGNIWEWCSTAFEMYPYDAGDGREEMAAETLRIVRGGVWTGRGGSARCAYRIRCVPDNSNLFYSIGFRVAMDRANRVP